MVSSEHVMIGTDFLQARLHKDWEEFERQGQTIVVKAIPRYNLDFFRDAFRKLEKAECQADVLFPCIYIFLNSRGPRGKELQFPRREDWKQIPAGLDRVRKKMEALTNESGIATLMDGDGCWDRGWDLDAFSSFKILHQDFLGAMNQYIVELENFCRVLPCKDVIRQYGQAVICTYVKAATKLPFSKASSLTQTLLERCSGSALERAEVTANWARDIKRFREDYPLFCERAQSFLTAKHNALVKPLTPKRDRSINKGNRK
jgi:hypothetical protein